MEGLFELDFEPVPGLGRGQALLGAGAYGHQANVCGILPPGGRGGPADLTTPIFMTAGEANYRNGMQGVRGARRRQLQFSFRARADCKSRFRSGKNPRARATNYEFTNKQITK